MENDMDYEFWFWMVIAFVIGRGTAKPFIYIGNDYEKYKDAWLFGLYWRK